MHVPYSKIFIHFIWSPKYREPLLVPQKRYIIQKHIREACKENDIYVFALGGYYDHLHLLAKIPTTMSISKAMNLIKGESSRWINQQKLFIHKFSWQKRYSAFSVSRQHIKMISNYIRRQEIHHKDITLEKELEQFSSFFLPHR